MTKNRKQIGWIEREEGYYKLYEPVRGSIVTQAFIHCQYCNGAIYHCMGPKYDAVCLNCFEIEPELRNMLAGANIVTDDKGYEIGNEKDYEEFVRKRNE